MAKAVLPGFKKTKHQPLPDPVSRNCVSSTSFCTVPALVLPVLLGPSGHRSSASLLSRAPIPPPSSPSGGLDKLHRPGAKFPKSRHAIMLAHSFFCLIGRGASGATREVHREMAQGNH